ncbi:Sodium/calcium exchanger 1 [Orchesella cincta]|uniref:Sodium/calcium exchanger 1 n=1 Tax=Orchesella cincta TaxID=48709 RepID=A0A1D2M726_ORCCI|nr:Sodium/calcium exchanger 1 [Orchesella cincta]
MASSGEPLIDDSDKWNYNGTYNDICPRGLLLPIFPFEGTWNTTFRAILYCFGLLYCFMGVAIVADVFMGSIEKITSKTKKIYLSAGGKDSEPDVFEIKIWNDTVANLTLMALGSSAPEILLSCIEIIGNNFESGELGPGTIVGSAAFNLLVICAVCIMAIPNGETRCIRLFSVFLVTSIFSLFAYLWMLVILNLISPNVVETWEAALTFLFFPLLVLIAWWADRGWKCGKRTPTVADQQIELGMENGSPGGECESMLDKQKKLFTAEGDVDKEALIEFYKELRKFPHLNDTDAAILAATKQTANLIPDCGIVLVLYVIFPEAEKYIQYYPTNFVYDTINQSPDVPDIGDVPQITDQASQKSIVEFHAASYAVPVRIRVESFDGTAKAGSDYVQINEQIVFGPYAKERELTVKIIDDNQWEPDEEFFLRLSIIDDGYDRRDVVLGRLPIMEIIILNDDEPGVLSFRKRGLLVKESCQFACIDVERTNGADGDISVNYRTIDGSAKSPNDYQGSEGTLVFKHGETLRTIEIPIVDDLKPERDECFEIELANPEGGAKLGRITKMAITISNDDAITFVALGTSLPDLFASKAAATSEKYADNAVGNVTGSNSVNVFLGLGLPWLMAAIFMISREILSKLMPEILDLVLGSILLLHLLVLE